MAIPDYQSLMLPLLQLAAEGETSVPQAADILAGRLHLTPEEREEMLPSRRMRVLHNRIHWAKYYMEKAGLLDRVRRGVVVAAPPGRALLATNPAQINNETLKRYPSFLEFYRPSAEKIQPKVAATLDSDLTATPEDQIDAAYSLLKQELKADLLQRVLEQSPAFFERMVVELLVAMGYGGSHEEAARQLGQSGDGGVDGVIDEERLGLDRIYIQAKRFTEGTVSRPLIQGFVGSLVGVNASKGVFFTTSSFSKQAEDYVKGLQQRVILIDGDRLTELMIEYGVGVRISQTIEIKRPDEDFFTEA